MSRSIRAVAATLVLAGCVEDPIDDQLSQDEQELNVLSGAIWASSDIPVCWDNPGYIEEKGWVRDAIRKTWEAESNVEFIGWGSCNRGTSSGIRIKISDEWPATLKLGNALNNLPAGMLLNFEFERYRKEFAGCQRDGSQRESCIRNIAIHEFGHALGFAHEQLRPDTPQSCTAGVPFDIGGDMVIGPWDLSSVMNYCNPVWTNAGILTGTDIAGVQQMYGSRKPIASVAWSPNRTDAFVHRTDNVLGSTIAGVLPVQFTGAPAMVSTQAGRADVFLRGTDARLYTSRFNGTSFSPMVQVAPGQFVGSPAAVVRGNTIDVFVRGTDHGLYVNTWNGSSWSGYNGLGGVIAGNPVAVASGSTIDVFARGQDGAVWTARFDGTWWSPVTSLGGVIAGNPAAVITGPNGQVSVFARGMNDALWIRSRFLGMWDPGFTQVAPNIFLGDPSVASWGTNRIDVFVRGFDGNLYTNSYTGTAWTGYSWLGGPILASPTVYAPAPNRLEVLVRGTDSNLYKKLWNGSSWSAFLPMGNTVR